MTFKERISLTRVLLCAHECVGFIEVKWWVMQKKVCSTKLKCMDVTTRRGLMDAHLYLHNYKYTFMLFPSGFRKWTPKNFINNSWIWQIIIWFSAKARNTSLSLCVFFFWASKWCAQSGKEMERGRDSAWQRNVQARENVENERMDQCGREWVGEREREKKRKKKRKRRKRWRWWRIYLELLLINFSISLCLWGWKRERVRERGTSSTAKINMQPTRSVKAREEEKVNGIRQDEAEMGDTERSFH